jgi:hypothetical protein
MTEPETEIDALDRLEAALGRIAAHAASTSIAAHAASASNAAHAASASSAAHAAGEGTALTLDGAGAAAVRRDVATALDRLIVQLRDALASIGEAEHG